MKATFVIGANYGDEGKGLLTRYHAMDSLSSNTNCKVLNILCNGGAQRGHTVETKSGLRHVYHHFGSATDLGVPTYMSKEFIVNPIAFRHEYAELIASDVIPSTRFVHSECRITTPFDMMLNQLKEESRGDNRHGSCGYGIYETIERDKIIKPSFNIGFVKNASVKEISTVLKEIYSNVFIPKANLILNSVDCKLNPSDRDRWEHTVLIGYNLIAQFMSDLMFMLSKMTIISGINNETESSLLNRYDHLVFEMGQGLMLDKSNIEWMPHLTPSHTGSENPLRILDRCNLEFIPLELCYVTRTYYTRHGAGPILNGVDKSVINNEMHDKTNVPNEYQETMKYGLLDLVQIKNQIKNDLPHDRNLTVSLAITHINEYNKSVESLIESGIADKMYRSETCFSEDIESFNPEEYTEKYNLV